jgi:hypothetical protein
MIAFMIYEYLGFVFQTAKSTRMNDPIAIALKRRSIRMLRFRIAASAGFVVLDGVGSKHHSTKFKA